MLVLLLRLQMLELLLLLQMLPMLLLFQLRSLLPLLLPPTRRPSLRQPLNRLQLIQSGYKTARRLRHNSQKSLRTTQAAAMEKVHPINRSQLLKPRPPV